MLAQRAALVMHNTTTWSGTLKLAVAGCAHFAFPSIREPGSGCTQFFGPQGEQLPPTSDPKLLMARAWPLSAKG